MEKVSLPIKTKIAAWWMMIVGAIVEIGIVVFGIVVSLGVVVVTVESYYILLLLVFFAFLFLLGFFILRNKKWAWGASIPLLLIGLIFFNFNSYIVFLWKFFLYFLFSSLPHCLFTGDCYIGEMLGISGSVFSVLGSFFIILIPLQIPLIVPLILLLLDRKNFWKITS